MSDQRYASPAWADKTRWTTKQIVREMGYDDSWFATGRRPRQSSNGRHASPDQHTIRYHPGTKTAYPDGAIAIWRDHVGAIELSVRGDWEALDAVAGPPSEFYNARRVVGPTAVKTLEDVTDEATAALDRLIDRGVLRG